MTRQSLLLDARVAQRVQCEAARMADDLHLCIVCMTCKAGYV